MPVSKKGGRVRPYPSTASKMQKKPAPKKTKKRNGRY